MEITYEEVQKLLKLEVKAMKRDICDGQANTHTLRKRTNNIIRYIDFIDDHEKSNHDLIKNMFSDARNCFNDQLDENQE